MTSFKEKLILNALEEIMPDLPPVTPTKPEAHKVKAIFTEMAGYMDIGGMKPVVEKVVNIVLFAIEKDPKEQEKARQLLAKIKGIIEAA